MQRGRTYALVGPTGAARPRRFPQSRASMIHGRNGIAGWEDIRSYSPEERARKIGFILQEPFLFTGTVRENILYGNERYREFSTRSYGPYQSRVKGTSRVSRLDLLITFRQLFGGKFPVSFIAIQNIFLLRAVNRKGSCMDEPDLTGPFFGAIGAGISFPSSNTVPSVGS